MIKLFGLRFPRTATGLIYLAGYLAGWLIGVLGDYLISGVVKASAGNAFGSSFGVLALGLAQHYGLVPARDDLNKPISLFGPDGYHGDGK